eukprot:148745-Chlamydomonas_euryale.AAC.1
MRSSSSRRRSSRSFTLSCRRHSWRVHAEKGNLEAKLLPHTRWTKKARRCDHRTAPTSARHCARSCARQYHSPSCSTRSSHRVALAESIHRRLGRWCRRGTPAN